MSQYEQDHLKEQVRQATDIVDLVGSYLPLHRAGRNYKALCPWHDDSDPSLQINPERQIFKCWVCDIGGDVFSFVMRMEGVEFVDALTQLAEKAGIALKPTSRGPAGPSDEKAKLFKVAAWAEEQYHRYLLRATEAQVARDYAAERGITTESIERFKLGFSPPQAWDWLLQAARPQGIAPELLARLGLAIVRDNGSGHYDRFRGRLLFSIRDVRDRPIALGGRVLPLFADDKDPKYINSPETPLFSKSQQLYGLGLARQEAIKQRRILVMEGYTDVIAAHQAGLTNTVAVLGTALSEKHIPILRRYADEVLLVLDGDEAGQKRAGEVLEIFLAHSLNLKILTLPQGLDPCDVIASQGRDGFLRLMDQAVDALEYKIQQATDGMVAIRDTHRAHLALEEILGTLSRLRTSSSLADSALVLREGQVLARLARDFHLPEADLRTRLQDLRRGQSSNRKDSPPAEEPTAATRISPWEETFLQVIACRPQMVEEIAEFATEDDFSTDEVREIFAACRQIVAAQQEPQFAHLMNAFAPGRCQSLLVQTGTESTDSSDAVLEEKVRDLRRASQARVTKASMQQRIGELSSGRLNSEEERSLLTQLFDDLKARQEESRTPR